MLFTILLFSPNTKPYESFILELKFPKSYTFLLILGTHNLVLLKKKNLQTLELRFPKSYTFYFNALYIEFGLI